MAWETQPILFISCVMGGVGPLFVLFGPGSKRGEEEMRNWPTHYRCKLLESTRAYYYIYYVLCTVVPPAEQSVKEETIN